MQTGEHRRAPFLYLLARSGASASTFTEAVESCLHDLERQLGERGCVLDDVVHVRAFLPSQVMTVPGYAEYNQVYNRFFHGRGILEKPARASVGIDPIQGLEVKMEVFAMLPVEREAQS